MTAPGSADPITDRAPWVIPRPYVRKPVVSVLIVSKGRERALMCAEAVQSVHAQTFQDYELLQWGAAEWWPSKWNDLALLARGKFLVLLPDDDRLHPDFLQATVAAAHASGAEMVYTDLQIFGARSVTHDFLDFGLETFKKQACPWTTMLIRTSLWHELKGYDPDQDHQDTDLGIRIAKLPRQPLVWHVRERLVYAREHEDQGGRRMNHSSALLRLQAKHPDVYPSAFIAPAPLSVEEAHAIEVKSRWDREAREQADARRRVFGAVGNATG